MRLRATIICMVGSLFIGIASAYADPDSCADAASQYKTAKSDVEDALKAYNDCIDSADGHDDCSSEFETLKSAQDDFESAVSDYESECN